MKHTNHRRFSIRRAVTALSVVGALTFAACDSGQDVTEPVLPADELPNAEFRAASFLMDVDMRTGDVTITPPNADKVAELNPSIVAGDVIELTADNFFASLPGQFVPGKVRVTFDVTIYNKLVSVNLVTPTFPEPPVDTDGILLFPFETSVTQSNGGVSANGDEVIFELPSRGQVDPSTDFDGEPFNFFNDSDCLSTDNDCYRYETFTSPLLPDDVTVAQQIGFDVDPTVGSFRARLIVAADLDNSGGIPTGDVAGSVTSAARADLGDSVEVIVDGIPSGFLTYPGGSYTVAGARAGLRSFQVTGVPTECTVINAPAQVQVLAGGTVTVNVDFDCPEVCIQQTEIPTIECEALVELYQSTNGPGWTNNSGWLVTDTPCSWYGVTCGAGFVQELRLWGNALAGSIPVEMGNLSNLEELNLGGNQLSGTIPPELGNLSNLESINLEANLLTGSIPAELGNLSNLRTMWITTNPLTGPIPASLGNLDNLQSLVLWGNQLTGSIPAELGNLSTLTTLWLYLNQLTGSIPAELGNLSNLEDLDLRGNQLTGSIPAELSALSSLEDLSLSANQLSGTIPPELGNLSSLASLTLSMNQLTGSIPAQLGNASNLWGLALSENQLSGYIPEELGNLSNLRYLYLDDNLLTGPIPASLGSFAYLSRFYLHDNQLNAQVPLEVAQSGGPLTRCLWVPGNTDLYMPDTPDYRAADLDGDGYICGLAIGEPATILFADDFNDLDYNGWTVLMGTWSIVAGNGDAGALHSEQGGGSIVNNASNGMIRANVAIGPAIYEYDARIAGPTFSDADVYLNYQDDQNYVAVTLHAPGDTDDCIGVMRGGVYTSHGCVQEGLTHRVWSRVRIDQQADGTITVYIDDTQHMQAVITPALPDGDLVFRVWTEGSYDNVVVYGQSP